MIPALHPAFAASALLFVLGAFGMIVRRNLVAILLSAQLMLLAAVVAVVTFSRWNLALAGRVLVLTLFVIMVLQVIVGFGLARALERKDAGRDVDDLSLLKG